MDAQATAPFLRHFRDLPDPRRHNVRHVFADILTIAILGVLCTCDDWDDVVVWATARRDWLGTFLALPNGIPCADTFARVFARLDPDAFERRFVAWTADLATAMRGEIVAVDGKTLRRSFAHAWDRQGAIHLVGAFAAGNRLVLGQLAVDGKGNEITAIPKLLELLSIGAATVTIDAMGCQREVAATIRQRQAHYVLAVKDNQPTLHAKVAALLDEAVLDRFAGMGHGYHESTDGGHGRVETRKVWVTDEVNWLGAELLGQWRDLASVAVVESTRDVMGKGASTERRYFISSHAGVDAALIARAIRAHWGIENGVHWQLDMTFNEDASRLRKGHGAANFSRLRRVALNLLKRAPGKGSLKGKRFRCSLEQAYLLQVLQSQ
jgi:predicted transposase YbfD/YdcC